MYIQNHLNPCDPPIRDPQLVIPCEAPNDTPTDLQTDRVERRKMAIKTTQNNCWKRMGGCERKYTRFIAIDKTE